MLKAEVVRNYLASRGVGLPEVAEKICTNIPTLSGALYGKCDLPQLNLRLLAKYLECDVCDISDTPPTEIELKGKYVSAELAALIRKIRPEIKSLKYDLYYSERVGRDVETITAELHDGSTKKIYVSGRNYSDTAILAIKLLCEDYLKGDDDDGTLPEFFSSAG